MSMFPVSQQQWEDAGKGKGVLPTRNPDYTPVVHPRIVTFYTVHIVSGDGTWLASTLRGESIDFPLPGSTSHRRFLYGWFCTTCTERGVVCSCKFPYAGRVVTKPVTLVPEEK